ncbi:SDR family oxidoreductase [Nocardioides bizhenqiangii]|uniref:SDR family NAD(P)-dependent oxidoreductase n=1 Tax=Nocardioides bizhenqiangii TaxID=3095076 RepID=A0ABZ0ZRW0_9ACTN|nr:MULTISPECIES: SDR family NAD(P)-dependent oxidoreductase [unclassified Nocardioides]MDZ5619476.1 SDR family NAD(P)-dependent oxidoreductase [Nocardioides sp. HM23]WQQ26506.1 SDR family NAD(P)-dependent oxidoreductase [Nocardioides sp. HM61]
MSAPVYVVLGAGPGLGLAVARRFAQEGYVAVLATRTKADAEPLAAALQEEGHAAQGVGVDLTDAADVSAVVTAVGERNGRIDVLHFNPSAWREKDPLHLTVPELLEDVALGAGALLPAVQAARPYLASGARVLVTGSAAADKPSPAAASLGVQKAAVRNLVSSLDATLAPDGIRAVAVQINGVLGRDGAFSPPPIADAMWAAVSRPDDAWTPHVPYDG